MDLRIGDIVVNGFIVEIYQNLEKDGERFPEGHWMGDRIYIYEGLSDGTEQEFQKVLEYIFNEGFSQDRRTEYTVVRAEDFD